MVISIVENDLVDEKLFMKVWTSTPMQAIFGTLRPIVMEGSKEWNQGTWWGIQHS